MLKVLELFSGYGSQSLALKYSGIEHESTQCDIDKYAVNAYNQIHGETLNLGDISKVDEFLLPFYDLITYSFPCTDISTAGKQEGFSKDSGTRSSLLWECERIFKWVRPNYLLMENVKALVNKKNKPLFEEWLKVLEDMGYTNYWQVINAKDCGIPQNRERVFCVSIRNDINQSFKFPKKQELTLRLKDLLEDNVAESYYLKQEQVDRFLASTYNVTASRLQKKNWCDCLNSRDYKDPKCVEVICAASRGRNPENPNDRTTGGPTKQRLEINTTGCSNTLTTVQKDNYVVSGVYLHDSEAFAKPPLKDLSRCLKASKHDSGVVIQQVGNLKQTNSFGGNPQTGRIYSADGLSPTINTMQGGQREPKILIGSTQKNAFIGDGKECSTLTSAMGTGGGHVPMVGFDDSNTRIRKLTPRECWRLMGVKDEDFDEIKGISNSQLYKMAGNSIVTNCLMGVFYNLLVDNN